MRTLLALIAVVALASVAFAHLDSELAPNVVSPASMSIDGSADDWGWYDADSYGIGPERTTSKEGGMEHTDLGPNPDPEDFNMSIWNAWSPPPDNAWYSLVIVNDDTLRVEEVETNSWWNDDVMKMGYDWDHGANYDNGSGEFNRYDDGYLLEYHPVSSQDDGAGNLANPGLCGRGPPWNADDGPIHWGGEPPYTNCDVGISPPGATTLTPNVTVVYEIRHVPWAIYSQNGPEQSVLHTFAADQTVHACNHVVDADRSTNGEQDFWSSDTGDRRCNVSSDFMTDYLLIDEGTYDGSVFAGGTAVEHTTWARIKSQLTR